MLAAEREVERYSKARWIILIQQWMMTVGWEMNQEALTSPKTPVPLCRRTTVDIRVTYLGLGGVGGYEKKTICGHNPVCSDVSGSHFGFDHLVP